MAYKFQIGNFRSGGNIQMAGGTSLSGSITNSVPDDATAAAVVAEIDNGEIPIAKLAAKTISGKDLGGNLDNLTAGDGLSGGTYNGGSAVTMQVDLKTNAGLDFDSGELIAKVDGAKAMDVSAQGLAVKLRADKGLGFHSDGLEIQPESNKGIGLSSNGISVVVNANASAQVDSNGVGVKLSADKGLGHDGSNGLRVLLQADKGLSFAAGGLAAVVGGDDL